MKFRSSWLLQKRIIFHSIRPAVHSGFASGKCRFQSSAAANIQESNCWDVSTYRKNASYVMQESDAVLRLLAPVKGEKILDLGCGEGTIARSLADFGCHVIGVDASEAMVEAARAQGVEAYRMDGHDLQLTDKFDAVFSNAAMHWMARDPPAVIRSVKRVLKPDGRFVSEFGGHGNLACLITALCASLSHRGVDADAINPWFFPAAGEYRGLLEQEGFKVDCIDLFPRPTFLPHGMRGFLDTFGHSFFEALSEDSREEVIEEVLSNLKGSACYLDGKWTADYTRLKFKAFLSQA